MVQSGLWGMKMMFYEEKVTNRPSEAASGTLQSYVNNGTFEPPMQITTRKLMLHVPLFEVHRLPQIVIETRIPKDQVSKVLYIPAKMNLRRPKCRKYKLKRLGHILARLGATP